MLRSRVKVRLLIQVETRCKSRMSKQYSGLCEDKIKCALCGLVFTAAFNGKDTTTTHWREMPSTTSYGGVCKSVPVCALYRHFHVCTVVVYRVHNGTTVIVWVYSHRFQPWMRVKWLRLRGIEDFAIRIYIRKCCCSQLVDWGHRQCTCGWHHIVCLEEQPAYT